MIKKTSTTHSHESIVRDVRAGSISPVYYLMGEESYYIDQVCDFLVDNLLSVEERDFNLITLFGAETDTITAYQSAMGFPMGAERLVVVVKDAQNLKDLEQLERYLKQPQKTSVLIFCHKNGNLDKRKGISKLLEKYATIMESPKLKDYQLPTWITQYLRRKKVAITPEAAEMLGVYVGTDLNRLTGEIEKLILSLPTDKRTITSEIIEKNIGISKEFNIFELTDALGKKDIVKVNQIANYFNKNERHNPIQKTLPALFRYFSNLMLAYYAPNKSKSGIASWLGLTEWQVEKNILPVMSIYNGRKVMSIISQIRSTDAKSKGVNNPSISSGVLMKELLYFILH